MYAMLEADFISHDDAIICHVEGSYCNCLLKIGYYVTHLPYMFECICLHNTEKTLRSHPDSLGFLPFVMVSKANR